MSDAQRRSVQRIVGLSRAARHDFVTEVPEEAARRLLGPRWDYNGDGCAVEPFDPARLSLPSVGGSPVLLNNVLDEQAKLALGAFESHLLADEDVAAQKCREGPKAS